MRPLRDAGAEAPARTGPLPAPAPPPAPPPAVAARWHLAAAAAMTVIAVADMRGWLFQDLVPNADFPGYAAVVIHVRDALLRYGRVPSWSPKWFAGTTVFLSTLKECLTVPLALALGPVLGIKLVIVGAKIAAGLGFYAIFVRFFRAPAAGMLAAYAYAFGPLGNLLAERLDGAISYALFPALFVAAVEVLRRRRAGAAAAFGFLAACQFDDNYVHVLACGPMLLALLLLRPWRTDAAMGGAAPASAGRWLGLGAIAAGVFLVFGGSQLAWLAFDLPHHAFFPRAEVERQMRYLSEYSPFLLVNRTSWLGAWLHQHQPLGINVNVDRTPEARYLGGVALATCALGWLAARRAPSLRRWYQAGLLLFGLLYWLALGPWTLAWSVLTSFHWRPGAVEVAQRWLTVVGLASAAAGVVRIVRRRSAGQGELLLGLGLCLLAASRSAFALLRVLPPLALIRSPGKFLDLAPFAFALVFGVSLVAIAARLPPRPWLRASLAIALGALLVADYWPSTERFFPGIDPAAVAAATRLVERLPAEEGTVRVLPVPAEPPLSSLVLAASEAGGAASWLPWQAGAHTPPYLAALNYRLLQCLRGTDEACDDPLFAIARVRWVLHEGRPMDLRPPWTRVGSSDGFELWQRPEVLPMAYAYRSWVVLPEASDDALMSAVLSAFPHHVAVVAGDEPEGALLVRRGTSDPTGDPAWKALIDATPAAPLLPAVYHRPEPEHVVLEIDAGGEPALVFVAESYHPWWQATVDGVPATVARAAGAFMAVRVGPGRHVVDLRLRRPAVVAAADGVARLAWPGLALAGLIGFATRRRAQRGATPS